MDYRFRDEVFNAKKAAMGEMYNLAKEHLRDGDKLINFASGHPSTEVFQDKLIKRYLNLTMEVAEKDILQYGAHAGYLPLRQTFKKFVNEKGNVVKPEDDLIITYGSVEAIFLTALALVNKGDKVIVEVPSYVNAIKSFQIQGAEVIGVPMQDDGVDLEKLESAMRQGAKLFYTVPNFGNPSGITMSLSKRKEVYELGVRYQVLIVEDDPYGDLRYRNERIPHIKEFDTEGAVAYINSMSKLIAPAMRVGFLVANKEFIKRIIPIKAVSTNGVTSIIQFALWKMFEENDMYAQIQKICDVYSKKLFLMEKSMDKYFPEGVKHSSPDGGMYIWVTLPDGTDIGKLCKESAIQLHIPITPGNGFCVVEPESCTSLRFNFVKESLEDIDYGIQKIGKLMQHYI
ncbi:PLP-dependent aminotransferase family protein [Parablautia intestinalis]|uniref:PLP-dependent aminotransferase family protein n=1 Tax=Parablautia intestinalis TaxID=2320100 RepID=A0A3A9AJF6_9FIRM|nr:PLP-dependent aminotransferase family protein [Parablautia intestinalis]RKI87623.1 PLP-dependent aminotransferase family protein [Parablautia intestinalis]